MKKDVQENDKQRVYFFNAFGNEWYFFPLVYTGLAWAICEHLTEVTRAPTLFATHFHELTALEKNQESGNGSPIVGIANYHVKAHLDKASQKLTMLYKVMNCPQRLYILR